MSKNLIIFGDFTADEIEEIIEEFDINEEVNENKRNLSDFVFTENDLKDWIKQQNKINTLNTLNTLNTSNTLNKNHQEESCANYDVEFSVSLFEIYHKTRIMLEEEALEYQFNLHKKYYGI